MLRELLSWLVVIAVDILLFTIYGALFDVVKIRDVVYICIVIFINRFLWWVL